MRFEFFVEDSVRKAFEERGSQVSALISDSLLATIIDTADSQLGAGGELRNQVGDTMPDWQVMDTMEDGEWRRFIDARAKGRPWDRWFGKKGSMRFNIIVYR